jgi:subtilisin family serine protease
VSVLGKRLGEPPDTEAQQDDSTVSADGVSRDFTNALEHIRVDEVWEDYSNRGDGVRVSVIDTGVDPNHADIDIKDQNWKCYEDCSGEDGPHDKDGHGTHTSGTIVGGDANYENIQIGVAPDAELLHAKALGDDGSGSYSDIFSAIQWSVSNNADIISMSLGNGAKTVSYVDLIRNAEAAGVVLIASIGNDGVETSGSPGNVYDSVSVGSSEVNSRYEGGKISWCR